MCDAVKIRGGLSNVSLERHLLSHANPRSRREAILYLFFPYQVMKPTCQESWQGRNSSIYLSRYKHYACSLLHSLCNR